MLSLALLAAFAAIAAAIPAPQALDLAAVLAATSPTATAPPLSAVSQTSVYDSSLATATIVVSSIASASASAAMTTPAAKLRRDVSTNSTSNSTSASSSSATFCWGPYPLDICIGGNYDTASPPNFYPTTTALSVKLATSTTSSSTACPTVPEAGTYCGFINPEDNCAPQPSGNGPHVEPDNVATFLAYPAFSTAANGASTPKGYVNTFKNLQASSSANSYLGLYTLSSYDVAGCSQWCDNTTLCTAFNIYVERDPSLNPSASQCSNPASITNYKCTLWGSSLDSTTATNAGGWRGSFQVVIAGSNGYDKSNNTSPTTCPGWKAPQNCGNKVHNHPSTCLGSKFYPGPFNPQVCATLAAAQNKANTASSQWAKLLSYLYNPLKCNFFNAYELKQDQKPLGTYCMLYSSQYSTSQASYVPGWLSGHYYGVGPSWSYSSSS